MAGHDQVDLVVKPLAMSASAPLKLSQLLYRPSRPASGASAGVLLAALVEEEHEGLDALLRAELGGVLVRGLDLIAELDPVIARE